MLAVSDIAGIRVAQRDFHRIMLAGSLVGGDIRQRQICVQGLVRGHIGHRRILGVGIIGIVEAVALHGVLRSHHSDGDAVNRLIHVVVAGALLHLAGDGQHVGIHGLTVLGGQMVLLAQGVGRTVQRHGPVDDVVQLGIAPNTADDQLVLQGQIAVVHHTQLRQGIGAARLPQNLLARSSLDPVQCLALGGDPAVALFHLQSNIQLAGLNFVDAGACRVGEPCEGSAYQHSQARTMAMMLPSKARLVDLRFVIVSSPKFFCVCGSWPLGFCGNCCKGNTDRHSPCEHWLRNNRRIFRKSVFSLNPPYRFFETIKAHGLFGEHLIVAS